MRSRPRRLMVEIWLAAAVLTACSSHTAASGETHTTGSHDPSEGERFPYIAPTAAAKHAIGAYRLDRGGHDCDSGAADAGFPTTTAATTPTTCLRDADRAGDDAFTIITGRDGSGGALLTSYRTAGSGHVSVLDVYADPKGELRVTRWTCALPQAPALFPIGFGGIGHLVVAPFAGCRRLGG